MLRSVLLLFTLAPVSPAAWVVTVNETKETLVVQTYVTVNGKPVAAKPVKLVAGETLRQFQAAPTAMTVQILEPGKAKPLSTTEVTLKDKDLKFTITNVGGQVKLVEQKKK